MWSKATRTKTEKTSGDHHYQQNMNGFVDRVDVEMIKEIMTLWWSGCCHRRSDGSAYSNHFFKHD